MKTVREESLIPDKIYLQVDPENQGITKEGVFLASWSRGQRNGSDEKYIREATAQAKHEAEIGEALSMIESLCHKVIDAHVENCLAKGMKKVDACETALSTVEGEVKFLDPYKKTSVPCEECGGEGSLQFSVDPDDGAFCPSCQGKGTVERWEEK